MSNQMHKPILFTMMLFLPPALRPRTMKKPELKPLWKIVTGNNGRGNNKDSAAIDEPLRRKAVLMPKREEPVLGKAAIGEYTRRKSLNPHFAPFTLKSDWNSFQLAGDFAIAASDFPKVTRQDEIDKQIHFHGKNLLVWKKQPMVRGNFFPLHVRRDSSQEITIRHGPFRVNSQLSELSTGHILSLLPNRSSVNSIEFACSIVNRPRKESSMKSTTIHSPEPSPSCASALHAFPRRRSTFIGKWKLNLSKSKLADQMTIAPRGKPLHPHLCRCRRHRDSGGGWHRPARSFGQHHFHYR